MIADAAQVQAPDLEVPLNEARLSPAPSAPLFLQLPNRSMVYVGDWYKGRACFLICSGPSLKDMNLGLLDTPGVVTWGVNNSWAVYRPRFWTCVDPAEKFCDRGWRDPAITKVVPEALASQHLRYKKNGQFHRSRLRVRDCPAVMFWPRNSRFEPADFLAEPSVSWGCDEGHIDSLGIAGIRSVMLATLRLIHAFGFRTIYLLGCDFKMEEGRDNYAFPQDRTRAAIKHNTRLYRAMNARLDALRPYFEMDGTRVFNCTPGSGLTAFPFKRLSEAVEEATADCAAPMDASGWYEKPTDPRDEYPEYHYAGNGD